MAKFSSFDTPLLRAPNLFVDTKPVLSQKTVDLGCAPSVTPQAFDQIWQLGNILQSLDEPARALVHGIGTEQFVVSFCWQSVGEVRAKRYMLSSGNVFDVLDMPDYVFYSSLGTGLDTRVFFTSHKEIIDGHYSDHTTGAGNRFNHLIAEISRVVGQCTSCSMCTNHWNTSGHGNGVETGLVPGMAAQIKDNS